MTQELRSGGIKGTVRRIAARRQEVGRYVSLVRVPPLPEHFNTLGNGSGAYNGADIVSNSNVDGPAKYDIALRRSAFNADPKDRWILYVGRHTRPGEKAKVVGLDGPETQRAALRANCKGFVHVLTPAIQGGKRPADEGGRKRCGTIPVLTVPGR